MKRHYKNQQFQLDAVDAVFERQTKQSRQIRFDW